MPNRRKPRSEVRSPFDEETRAVYFEHVAARLARVRKLVEPQSADCARRVGVEPRVWWRYEQGDRELDMLALATFCVQYNVCPRWVLLGDPSTTRHPLNVALLNPSPGADEIRRARRRRDAAAESRRNSLSCALET